MQVPGVPCLCVLLLSVLGTKSAVPGVPCYIKCWVASDGGKGEKLHWQALFTGISFIFLETRLVHWQALWKEKDWNYHDRLQSLHSRTNNQIEG